MTMLPVMRGACSLRRMLCAVRLIVVCTAAMPARILQPGGLGLLSPRTAQRLERVVGLFRQFDSLELIEVSKSASGRNLLLVKSENNERQVRAGPLHRTHRA